MLNYRNSSSIADYFILGNTNSLTTAVWIINERNLTLTTIDVYQPIFRIMWYRFLLIIIIFVTAAGNILVCLAIARERKLQNTTNYFLMSLAIADCLVAILVMPMGMIAEVLGHFPLPHYACIIFATMDVLCCTSSIWHMSTMSMDRYFTIRFPFRYGRNKTRRIMLLKIITVWAISIAVSSPVFVLGIVDKENVLSNGVCAPNNASFKLYGSVFAFYIPFIIMITTYALTMRSLRNALVNKRKINRERRRKQTFQPFLQIVNQYAEIAHNLRRPSATNNQTKSVSTTNNNSNNNTKDISYKLVTTKSPKDSSTQNFLLNKFDSNEKLGFKNIQYGSIAMTNSIDTNNGVTHYNDQHLSINYTKRSASKKRHHYQAPQQQQQLLIMNTGMNRFKHDFDMGTVFETTESSKSVSNTHKVLLNGDPLTHQQFTLSGKQTQQETSKTTGNEEQQQTSSAITTTSFINNISPVEVDIYTTTDINGGTETNKLNSSEIFSLQSPTSTILDSIESRSLIVPWHYCFNFIQYILQYYLFIHPYRLRPLAIEYKLSKNQSKKISFRLNQSTSTSSLKSLVTKSFQSVSTQTNSLPPADIYTAQKSITNNVDLFSSIKRRKFPFTQPILSSSSFLTKLLRQTSEPVSCSHANSIKPSTSLGQHSPETSPSDTTRQQYPYHQQRHHCQHHSSNIFHPIESEMNHVLEDEHRPRASSSSSAVLRTTYHRPNDASFRRHRTLMCRQPFQSRSAYFLTYSNPLTSRQHQQQLSSTTNTNSSDSLSVFHRLNSKYFSSTPNHHQQSQQQQRQNQHQSQRIREEHIVAANERKALKVLLIIFCVFVTLWTPFFICTFISAICEHCRENISPTIWFSITWLGYSSSMANPFVYTIFSDAFRRAFTNIIFCRQNDSLFPIQYSTKLSYQKHAIGNPSIHRQLSSQRSPHPDHSRTSTPVSVHHKTSPAGSDATIYVNRCISDTCR